MDAVLGGSDFVLLVELGDVSSFPLMHSLTTTLRSFINLLQVVCRTLWLRSWLSHDPAFGVR